MVKFTNAVLQLSLNTSMGLNMPLLLFTSANFFIASEKLTLPVSQNW